ncbi:MAG: sugar phosphate isomerase/epimerase [Acidobacteriota bacterium]
MKFALNGATTMTASLETDIRAAREAGFDGLEIWAAKLRVYLKTHSTAELKKLFDEHGVEVYSINSIEHITFRDPNAYAAILNECRELCGIAADLNCPYIVVVPGLMPAGATHEQVIEESARVLHELADIAEAHNVKLAFEFLGQTDCSVQTLEVAKEIVERVGRQSVGLVIDSFHFYAGGSNATAIASLNPERLFIFHINDAEDRPRAELEDCHRLLPGLGILPLAQMIAAFRRINYDGVTSVEIFRPEYWERDPFELAKAARQALTNVMQ